MALLLTDTLLTFAEKTNILRPEAERRDEPFIVQFIRFLRETCEVRSASGAVAISCLLPTCCQVESVRELAKFTPDMVPVGTAAHFISCAHFLAFPCYRYPNRQECIARRDGYTCQAID